jgi:hypothetical protein
MSSARVRAASAALATIDAAAPGNARATNSTGRPASVVILPANPGSSSRFIAADSAARSKSEKSIGLQRMRPPRYATRRNVLSMSTLTDDTGRHHQQGRPGTRAKVSKADPRPVS